MYALQKFDIRYCQLVIMASLLLFGVWFRDFSLYPEQIVLTFVSGLTTQYLFLRYIQQ